MIGELSSKIFRKDFEFFEKFSFVSFMRILFQRIDHDETIHLVRTLWKSEPSLRFFARLQHLNSTRTARPFGGPGSSSRIQMLRFGAVFDRFGEFFGAETIENGAETIENCGETIENGADTIENCAETIENGAETIEKGAVLENVLYRDADCCLLACFCSFAVARIDFFLLP